MTLSRTGMILVLVLAAGPASAESCRDRLGVAKARRLVDRCLEVSPATHPPCNAENACDLITDEIARGCKLLGGDAPGYCEQH